MIYYTADLHIGHNKVSEIRGFDNSEYHDTVIYNNWRKVVKPDDIVWVLGDISVSNAGKKKAFEMLAELPGHKQLITGNHDGVSPMHRKSYKEQRAWLEVFDSVQAFARRRTDGLEWWMSHFPFNSDHTEGVRYPEIRLPDVGQLLVHGHTHSSDKVTSPREIHVGLDAWNLCLVPEPAIVDLFKQLREANDGSVRSDRN